MKYTNCLRCCTELEGEQEIIPNINDYGEWEFNVLYEWSSYPLCKGCDDDLPEDVKKIFFNYLRKMDSDYRVDKPKDDDLPF